MEGSKTHSKINRLHGKPAFEGPERMDKRNQQLLVTFFKTDYVVKSFQWFELLGTDLPTSALSKWRASFQNQSLATLNLNILGVPKNNVVSETLVGCRFGKEGYSTVTGCYWRYASSPNAEDGESCFVRTADCLLSDRHCDSRCLSTDKSMIFDVCSVQYSNLQALPGLQKMLIISDHSPSSMVKDGNLQEAVSGDFEEMSCCPKEASRAFASFAGAPTTWRKKSRQGRMEDQMAQPSQVPYQNVRRFVILLTAFEKTLEKSKKWWNLVAPNLWKPKLSSCLAIFLIPFWLR